MKKAQSVALVGAGPISHSALLRMSNLRHSLGPVKASSLRLASRIVNRIRAGYPVDSYGQFEKADVVLIWVPDRMAASIVEELASSGLNWDGRTVILHSPKLDSNLLSALAERGAATASFCDVDGVQSRLFIGEGDKRAVADLDRLLASDELDLIALRPGKKPLFLASRTLAGEMVLKLIHGAVESLRVSGLTMREALPIVETWVEATLRAYLRAGRKAPGIHSETDDAELAEQAAALAEALPELAPLMAGLRR
ncbi:MAG: hypothetical protein ACK5AZ_03265 [Bryobacteraceae bacterium]